jgi:DnaJ-class molecular chaperone
VKKIEDLDIKIPRGVEDGDLMEVKDEGEEGLLGY